jgi:hypothetical protein
MDYPLSKSKNTNSGGIDTPKPLGILIDGSDADLKSFGYLIWS